MKETEYIQNSYQDFFDYIKIQSISTQNIGIEETSNWLINQFKQLGAKISTKWNDQGGNPVVFASFKGKANKTILFYNHYDVQPPEPINEWKTNPFEPSIIDGKIYARGICDDKGELISRLTMIKYYQENGGLPVNLKFFVEGEEEIGSPHVSKYVKAHQDELDSNVCIWEGGGKDEDEDFQITCGLKGIMSFNLETTTADKDIHSSLANYADNAVWQLINALSSLKDKNNNITIKGFNDDIKPLDSMTKQIIHNTKFNIDRAIKNTGLKNEIITNTPEEDLINGTTLTINGISGGYEGEGIKTIIPKKAFAKLDCRLVPDQDPQTIFNLIENHLEENGFSDVKATYNIGEKPFRTNLNDPFIKLNIETAKEIYGNKFKVVPNMAGSGPAYTFYQTLNNPIVMIGTHYSGSDPHAPNEHIREQDFIEGTLYMINLVTNYAKK